jgi:hypothetical protein
MNSSSARNHVRTLLRVVPPALVLAALLAPWQRLRLTVPPPGPFRRGPVTTVDELTGLLRTGVVAIALLRLVVLGCCVVVLGSMLAAAARRRPIPKRLASPAAALACLGTVIVICVDELVRRSAYDGFGVALAPTGAVVGAALAATFWVSAEFLLVRRPRVCGMSPVGRSDQRPVTERSSPQLSQN